MTSSPPGAGRVLWIMARVSCRKFVNRSLGILSMKFGKKKAAAAAAAARAGTPRKHRISLVLLPFFFVLFLFNGMSISTQFVGKLSSGLDRRSHSDGRTVVLKWVYTKLEHAERELAALRRRGSSASESGTLAEREKEELQSLRLAFDMDLANRRISDEDRPAQVDGMMRTFDEKGAAGFRPGNNPYAILPSRALWPPPAEQPAMILAIGVFLVLLAIALFFMMLGSMNQDLGKVEWSMEWLFTFPVPAWVLFLARVCEMTLVNPFTWFVFFPFCLVVYICAGYAEWSVALGLLLSFYFGLLLACLHVATETGLRKAFPLNRLKNFQALFAVTGIVLFLAVMWLVTAAPESFLLDITDRVPSAIVWNPLSMPALLCDTGASPWPAAAAMALAAFAAVWLTVRASQRFVRDGLRGAAVPYQGVRGPAAGWTESRWNIQGIVGKEIRLLFRDRAFLVQALVIPLVIIAYNLMINPGFLKSASASGRHSAMLAFGVGTFVLMSSAFHGLAVEGPALWLLYTVPQPLHTVLLKKTYLWSSVALIYAAAVAASGMMQGVLAPVHVLMAFAGVIIYSFIASGIGVLATDPLEREQHRRIRPAMTYLYLILVGMYAHAIYNPAISVKIAQIVLSSLLAFALWQKVRDHCPYMLDPAQSPPPSLSLADGLITAQAFFVLQGMVALFLIGIGMPVGAVILVAYVVAGIVVGLVSLIVFWRQKVPDLFEKVGLRASRTEAGVSVVGSVAFGVAGGLVAAGLGLVYLQSIDWIEPLRQMKEEAMKGVTEINPDVIVWFGGLAILAAPVFEEFIFRGLIYQGLRRSVHPVFGIVASAAIFAIVHPPMAYIPVFMVGLVTAAVFEKTRLLIAPILVHMIYNAAVILHSY